VTNPFKYTRTARETTYKGTKFRSELEAAWAAFFDIRGIKWEYEPFYRGDTWRPDFSIKIVDDYQLAEVKPYSKLQEWKEDNETLNKIRTTFKKDDDVFAILLGASPLFPSNFIMGILLDSARFEDIRFGEEDLEEQWAAAKNTVRWKP
jgi:hypothetical protein